MAKASESEGYVEIGRVPKVDPRQRLADLLEEVGRRRAPFVLVETEGARQVLDWRRLTEQLVGESPSGDSLRRRMAERVGDLEPAVVEHARVAVVEAPLPEGTRPGAGRGAEVHAFSVQEEGREVGILLEEPLAEQVNAPPPVYICQNGHVNYSYNGGRCSTCPFPIETWQQG